VAGFSAIPAIAGHAMFNTTSNFVGGLFSTAQPSSSNAFWRMFGAAVESLGLPPFAVSLEAVITGCAVALALVLIAATKGRLRW
jgi:hypothetical protein